VENHVSKKEERIQNGLRGIRDVGHWGEGVFMTRKERGFCGKGNYGKGASPLGKLSFLPSNWRGRLIAIERRKIGKRGISQNLLEKGGIRGDPILPGGRYGVVRGGEGIDQRIEKVQILFSCGKDTSVSGRICLDRKTTLKEGGVPHCCSGRCLTS